MDLTDPHNYDLMYSKATVRMFTDTKPGSQDSQVNFSFLYGAGSSR